MKSWPRIHSRTNPGGTVTWMVDAGMVDGKRPRYFFKTKAEAETKQAQLRTERKNHGIAATPIPEWLRFEALQCQELLKPFGISPLEAVKAYIPHLEVHRRSIAVPDLVRDFLLAKSADGSSKRYLVDLEDKLEMFAVEFGARGTDTIAAHEIDDWLRGLCSKSGDRFSATTRNNFRRVLVILFNFAKRRKYCRENPATETEQAKTVEKPVGILSVPELQCLLNNTSQDVLPFVSISAFAGLRRSEMERLDWKEIDFHAGLIQVTAAKSKTARRRFVKIRPNLRAWLKGLTKREGPVTPTNYREELDRARRQAALIAWPHNALRHSFASYCLARENNAPALALEMGHTNTQMVFKHYREVVKPKEAKKYWKIVPA